MLEPEWKTTAEDMLLQGMAAGLSVTWDARIIMCVPLVAHL